MIKSTQPLLEDMKAKTTLMLLTLIAMSFSLTGCKTSAGDKILTKEQYKQYVQELGPLKEQLGHVFIEHSAIEDGKWILKISREELVELGFPSIAYDVALYDAHSINTTLEGLEEEVKKQVITDMEEQIQIATKNR